MGRTSVEGEKLALIEPLSTREIEILALIADHLSKQEIADQLHLTYGTVKWVYPTDLREVRRPQPPAGLAAR